MPEWYKKQNSYIDGQKIPNLKKYSTVATIKKCIPVFDAITSGYCLLSSSDLYVTQVFDEQEKKELPFFQWPGGEIIQFHSPKQLNHYPIKEWENLNLPKWINPWSISTPKGYSCLFITPIHRDLPFTILPGIVDTDKYHSPVNFPFILNDIKFTGLIPAGTPIAQVIPFKRESWKMNFGSNKEIEKSNNIDKLLKLKFFDVYRNGLWSSKIFK